MIRYSKIISFLSLFLIFAGNNAFAQSGETGGASNIVNAIMDSNPSVLIIQPDILTERLTQGAVIRSSWNHERSDRRIDPSIRYRIQVYSDNNRHSAKANAEKRKRLIEQGIPGMHGYVSYDSPYWRVRMGNYQTEAEAQSAMKQIKSKFPSFESDVRIVRVRTR